MKNDDFKDCMIPFKCLLPIAFCLLPIAYCLPTGEYGLVKIKIGGTKLRFH